MNSLLNLIRSWHKIDNIQIDKHEHHSHVSSKSMPHLHHVTWYTPAIFAEQRKKLKQLDMNVALSYIELSL